MEISVSFKDGPKSLEKILRNSGFSWRENKTNSKILIGNITFGEEMPFLREGKSVVYVLVTYQRTVHIRVCVYQYPSLTMHYRKWICC